MMGFDTIILSCNEDPVYSEFWPIVSWAYKKMFPNVMITLARVDVVDKFTEHVTWDFDDNGSIISLPVIPNIPQFAQAKMARFYLASLMDNRVCYIDDIDLLPLVKSFITDKTTKRPKDHLLCVGGEVYNNNGCYPISQMTAEGYVWKKFINPDNLEWSELMQYYASLTPKFDRRENPCIVTDLDKDDYFSDERLIRRLIYDNPIKKFEMARGYSNYLESTVDRHKWEINMDKLNNHVYLNAHCLRPYSKYKDKIQPLLDYIERTYA